MARYAKGGDWGPITASREEFNETGRLETEMDLDARLNARIKAMDNDLSLIMEGVVDARARMALIIEGLQDITTRRGALEQADG